MPTGKNLRSGEIQETGPGRCFHPLPSGLFPSSIPASPVPSGRGFNPGIRYSVEGSSKFNQPGTSSDSSIRGGLGREPVSITSPKSPGSNSGAYTVPISCFADFSCPPDLCIHPPACVIPADARMNIPAIINAIILFFSNILSSMCSFGAMLTPTISLHLGVHAIVTGFVSFNPLFLLGPNPGRVCIGRLDAAVRVQLSFPLLFLPHRPALNQEWFSLALDEGIVSGFPPGKLSAFPRRYVHCPILLSRISSSYP
jgi:hypothetical protein